MTPAEWNATLQVVIAISGVIGLYGALNWTAHKYLVAMVIAICGQPAWLFSTWVNEQYGMFSLSVIYTGIWLQAIFEALKDQGYLTIGKEGRNG